MNFSLSTCSDMFFFEKGETDTWRSAKNNMNMLLERQKTSTEVTTTVLLNGCGYHGISSRRRHRESLKLPAHADENTVGPNMTVGANLLLLKRSGVRVYPLRTSSKHHSYSPCFTRKRNKRLCLWFSKWGSHRNFWYCPGTCEWLTPRSCQKQCRRQWSRQRSVLYSCFKWQHRIRYILQKMSCVRGMAFPFCSKPSFISTFGTWLSFFGNQGSHHRGVLLDNEFCVGAYSNFSQIQFFSNHKWIHTVYTEGALLVFISHGFMYLLVESYCTEPSCPHHTHWALPFAGSPHLSTTHKYKDGCS